MSDWRKLRAVLTLCAALGWWGAWFPELAVWTDAVCVVQEESSASVQTKESVVEYEACEIYNGLLHADREQIKVKSRLIELLLRYMGREE